MGVDPPRVHARQARTQKDRIPLSGTLVAIHQSHYDPSPPVVNDAEEDPLLLLSTHCCWALASSRVIAKPRFWVVGSTVDAVG